MKNQFFSTDYDVFSFGKPPYAIEIMTSLKGLEFVPAFQQSTIEQVDGLPVRVIHLNQLIEAKRPLAEIKI